MAKSAELRVESLKYEKTSKINATSSLISFPSGRTSSRRTPVRGRPSEVETGMTPPQALEKRRGETKGHF